MGLFKKNKKEFVLIDFNKDGKGVEKSDETLSGPPYTLKRGTRLFFSRFWKLLTINFLFFFTLIPIILIVIFDATGPKTPVQETIIYSPLAGISVFEAHNSPSIEILFDFHAHEGGVSVLTLGKMLKIGIPLLFLFFTFGWQNCGVTYIIRSLINGEPVFIWSDFFYAIKKNLKQGMLVGMLDFAILSALVVDWIYFSAETGVFGNDLMYFLIIALAILYMFMRFYIYQLLITFDLKTIKIMKNALIFSILGILRNLVAFIGIILFLAIHVMLIIWLLPISTIPIVLPFVYSISIIAFISVYAAYPVIEKYMITPYETENEEKEVDSDTTDEQVIQ